MRTRSVTGCDWQVSQNRDSPHIPPARSWRPCAPRHRALAHDRCSRRPPCRRKAHQCRQQAPRRMDSPRKPTRTRSIPSAIAKPAPSHRRRVHLRWGRSPSPCSVRQTALCESGRASRQPHQAATQGSNHLARPADVNLVERCCAERAGKQISDFGAVQTPVGNRRCTSPDSVCMS